MFSFKVRTTVLSTSLVLVFTLLATLSGVIKADYEMTYCESADLCVTVCYNDQGQLLDLGECKDEKVAEAESAVADAASPLASTASTDTCPANQIGTMVVYTTSADGDPNTLVVAQVSFSALRSITDEELASGQPIMISSDGSSTPGLHVVVYWQTHQNGAADDAASCPL
jgi:hypothetical protein